MTSAEVLANAGDVRTLIVGDICLDRWCRYEPSLAEASRETGILRCAVTQATMTPGAGGTVAANLASLGAGRTSVLGAIGRDGFGFELQAALAAKGIESDLLIESEAIQTFTYTKLINAETGKEDLPRVDFVNAEPLPAPVESEIVERFQRVVDKFDAILVADQAETDAGGIVTPTLRQAIRDAARVHADKVFVVDSRERIERFRNVIAVPNEVEAEAACLREFGGVDYRRLYRRIGGPALVVTVGERGALLVDDARSVPVQTPAISEVVDTCGAGDSLAAGLALALAGGSGIESALRFGIIVAGITVCKPGTGYALPHEVLARGWTSANRE